MSRTSGNACARRGADGRGGAIGDSMCWSDGELGVINHKRVYRLYQLEGLKLRRRKRKRVAVAPAGSRRGECFALEKPGRWISCKTSW